MTMMELWGDPERFWMWIVGLGFRGLWALLFAVVGWFAGRLLRRVVLELVQRSGLEALSERVGLSRQIYALGIHEGLSWVLSRVFWVAWLMFVAHLVFVQLGLSGISQVFFVLLSWLPKLLVAAAILFGGVVLGDLCRRLVRSPARAHQGRELAAVCLYYTIIALALTMSLEQLGLSVTLIHTLVEVGLGVVMLCVAGAFTLSAKGVFEHLLARHYVSRMFQLHDELWLDDDTGGQVSDFSATALVLINDYGEELLIPYAQLLAGPTTLVVKDESTS